jgi:hypothetical protein
MPVKRLLSIVALLGLLVAGTAVSASADTLPAGGTSVPYEDEVSFPIRCRPFLGYQLCIGGPR